MGKQILDTVASNFLPIQINVFLWILEESHGTLSKALFSMTPSSYGSLQEALSNNNVKDNLLQL
jgi:hypothetical protein